MNLTAAILPVDIHDFSGDALQSSVSTLVIPSVIVRLSPDDKKCHHSIIIIINLATPTHDLVSFYIVRILIENICMDRKHGHKTKN